MFLNLHPLQILVPCIAGSASGARPQSWWRGEKNPSINLVPRAPHSLALFPAPPPKPGKSALGTKAAHQYFSKSNDKENEIRKHIREKRIRETGLFYILSSRNHAGGIFLTQYVALYSFHTWLSKL